MPNKTKQPSKITFKLFDSVRRKEKKEKEKRRYLAGDETCHSYSARFILKKEKRAQQVLQEGIQVGCGKQILKEAHPKVEEKI